MLVDVNYWKSFVYSRLATPMGEPGCLSLFGSKPETHELFADHLTAEYPVKVQAKGRTVDEWKLKASKPDNHWFDCLVGCAAAASMEGAATVGMRQTKPARQKKRLKLSELQRRRRRL